ncbi:transcription repressor OFP7-like [Impatiens glandulifera]|uniref:transcription repressor OFP7-like n=1 Tax=Impatiens glandulifera TaxID=253017 RepID=UPI001FB19D90|nr:transcription repressor OFP7-like [Impatiens glandulifera]
MGKGFKIRLSRLIPYFKSCRSKHPSNLPKDPVPTSSLQSQPNHPRRSSFKHNIPSTFFSTTPKTRLPSKPNPTRYSSSSSEFHGFKWQKFVAAAADDDDTPPRRKIYNSAASGCSDYSDDDDHDHDHDDDDDDNIFHSITPPEKKKKKQRSRRHSRSNRLSFRISTSSSMECGLFMGKREDDELFTVKERRKLEFDRETAPARLSVFIKRSLIRCGGAKAEGKVRESFAVMKRSEEPYEDFKRSMIEMILDKEMFDKIELEQLLACFLSLNSTKYHGIIVQAFADIWVSLFNL